MGAVLVESELGTEKNGHFTNTNGGKSLVHSFFKPRCLFFTVTDLTARLTVS